MNKHAGTVSAGIGEADRFHVSFYPAVRLKAGRYDK
jgi:hypothetical protein